ncbi:hypothetical protein K438DRAFT_1856212 [Mycena galopus ATCC 62051]|nr:hypothetical protein K438DRAFT_1856212 [Mycena galopus ATCC 62051]
MSGSSSALPSITNPPVLAKTVADYIELASLVIPARKLGMPERFRAACNFLPMPLSLGWDTDRREEHLDPDTLVSGLLLSDIDSGATRIVTASWMHALYKNILDHNRPGVIVLELQEAGYTRTFGWGHAFLASTFAIQLTFVLFAMTHGAKREGCLLLTACLVRIGEGLVARAFPRHRAPRSEYRDVPRPYALHTGMTTNHLLILKHRFGTMGTCINLEDAAVPLPFPIERGKLWAQRVLQAVLTILICLQRGASLLTSANGFAVPLVLVLGTLVREFVSAFADTLPCMEPMSILITSHTLLDRITAACQYTGCISVGFVENLLPDPTGEHIDYHWIRKAMQPADVPLPPHPTHPLGTIVQQSSQLRRRHRIPDIRCPPAVAT